MLASPFFHSCHRSDHHIDMCTQCIPAWQYIVIWFIGALLIDLLCMCAELYTCETRPVLRSHSTVRRLST